EPRWAPSGCPVRRRELRRLDAPPPRRETGYDRTLAGERTQPAQPSGDVPPRRELRRVRITRERFPDPRSYTVGFARPQRRRLNARRHDRRRWLHRLAFARADDRRGYGRDASRVDDREIALYRVPGQSRLGAFPAMR